MIEDLWYKNAIIYNLDIKTFLDVNKDGIGDLEGLARRLDYLDALGVDTIWLAPFQPTPNRDNGYDVQDYYGVDPRFGSSGDFVEFMQQAKKHGIKVLLDLVVNHTSDQHNWFQQARSSKDGKYRNWYVWSEKKPSDWNEGMVFPGVQERTWTYDRKAGAYYFHRFHEFQPDLNWENPDVRTEISRVIGFWIEMGASGFRLDAVPFILETAAPGPADHEMKFQYLMEIRRFLQWRKGDSILLGEANVLPKDSVNYFGKNGDGIQLMFNFYVNQYLFYALATADTAPLIKALEATRNIHPSCQWAIFLRNHDELDLGRLTDEERQKVFDRFGPQEHMQIYDRGIRRRLAPMLGSRQQLELAYSLMFSLPGTPVMRYGDEIGMGEDLGLKERDAVRTPMQWNNSEHAGFSHADGTVLPVIDKGPYSYEHVNVEDQRRKPESLLNWMTALIRLRKESPEIGWGNWEIIRTGLPEVLCMYYHWRGNSLVIIHNFEDRPHEVDLKLTNGKKEHRLVDMMRLDHSDADEKGIHRITLEAYGYRWYRAGDLTHLLRRERSEQQ